MLGLVGCACIRGWGHSMQVHTTAYDPAGDLENRVQALRLELREGHLADSVQHAEENRPVAAPLKQE